MKNTDSKEASVWDGIERSVDQPAAEVSKAVKAIHDGLDGFREAVEWDGAIPRVTMVLDYTEKTATLRAWEDTPEDMMFYLLDCLQQRTGFEKSHANRNTLREINKWIEKQLTRMIEEKMLWKEEGKWIFEG